MDYCRGIKWNTSVVQYFLITLCANFSFKKDTAQHHQLALGLSAEWSLWMNPSPVLVFWAKSAWWGPEPSACARWQLGERVPGQASAALSLVLWPPPLPLARRARHQLYWPTDWSGVLVLTLFPDFFFCVWNKFFVQNIFLRHGEALFFGLFQSRHESRIQTWYRHPENIQYYFQNHES